MNDQTTRTAYAHVQVSTKDSMTVWSCWNTDHSFTITDYAPTRKYTKTATPISDAVAYIKRRKLNPDKDYRVMLTGGQCNGEVPYMRYGNGEEQVIES